MQKLRKDDDSLHHPVPTISSQRRQRHDAYRATTSGLSQTRWTPPHGLKELSHRISAPSEDLFTS